MKAPLNIPRQGVESNYWRGINVKPVRAGKDMEGLPDSQSRKGGKGSMLFPDLEGHGVVVPGMIEL